MPSLNNFREFAWQHPPNQRQGGNRAAAVFLSQGWLLPRYLTKFWVLIRGWGSVTL